jgi:acyl-coenzyme A synthetase/AMP-(fatty) acid ligase
MIRPAGSVQLELGNRWRAEDRWPDRTLVEEMSRCALEQGASRVVFHSAVRPATVTVEDLHERARRVASGLRRLGVGEGDVVAMQTPNWLEGWVSHAAAWMTGAVVVPVVPIYGPHELRFILRQSGAKLLIVAREWRGHDAADLLRDLGELPALQAVVVVGEPLADTVDWRSLENATGQCPAAAAAPDDVCLVVYTSGTTADPKGVMHSHNTLLAEINDPIVGREAGPQAVHLAAFPAGHIAGVLGVLRVLVHGTPTVVMDSWDPVAAAALVEAHRVRSSVGAPIYLSGLLDAAAGNRNDISSLTEYMTGAANVAPSLIERAERCGIVAYRCYGSSEHPTITAGALGDPSEKRAGTDGRVLAGSVMRLVDDDGHDVPAGVEGEVVCQGPEQFLGYLDPALNEDAYLDGGWLRTGDIGRFDAQGYLTITDRKKDIIVRGGENISSKEVEDVLLTHPAVAEAAAVGAPDPRYGERVCAFVVLRPGASLGLAEARAHFSAAGLARQKAPERLEITDALPRTAAGKVQKFALRALLVTPAPASD